MRALVVVCVVVAAAAAARAQPAAPPAQLTLEDAVRLALSHNERAAIADLDVVQAQAAVRRARVAFLPVLQARGQDDLKPWDKTVDAASGSITITQPLYAPSAYPLYDQAKEQLAGQEAQSTDDRRTLAFDAARAYMSVLLAGEVVAAAQRKLDTATANVADTQANQRAQLVSTNDVTRAQIDLASSQRELASDRGQLDSAQVQLAFTINAPVAAVTPPVALLEAAERPAPDAAALVARAQHARPDLLARTHVARAAHDFAREPRARFWPTIGVSATASAGTEDEADGRKVDGSATLSASWTIWDAGARAADAASRDAAAEIADLTTDTLARTIDAQVRQSIAQLASAQQALAAARDAMLASQKSADETAILYRQGLARAIELVDANEQRFVAEVNFATAQFSVASAYLALRQTVGLDPIGGDL